ncbi:putative uncharacterized protein DDB_G0282133 [Zerene cesonia]|uniref:putative uncharacterized protein DDB_G0282133 n=1 Tax=Zerene cesonia TaxID=33412 RepID=UPI0018E553DE|nr:putative uncharacterized protein DDB_G0282133 [Zerene cesonia]
MTSIDNLKCVFCNEVFNDKEILQEHFRKHGDPLFDKSSKNKNKTQNEVPSSTEKTDDNELVGCDVCEEVFPTISKAITHKHKVHPDHDAKYFCPWCGKLFTMKHLFNKHLQSNHDGLTNGNEKNFHCDSCSVYFNVPSAMLHHNKFFHRQDTDLNSIGSSKKIKFYNQELVSIFYCPFCGEEYNNKVNLHKHMEDDHSDENQAPEDVLRCPLCEAFFYHLDAYELHLTFHSTEDLYSEQNEMVSEVAEFSLEAVPPIMEKVLSDAKVDPINNFLEMAMSEPEDRGRIKTKKHKKHKKSKKEAITFDEFLNMNKDVFGDGLNVQGIEEVPTQMVLKKKYKTKKNIANAETKNLNSDLAKLKKQGIVIKPSNKNSPSLNDQKNQTTVQTSKVNASVLSNPNDVISKLLRHGNSEIKIVKKSIIPEPENKQDTYQSNKIDSSSDYSKSLDNASQICTKENEKHEMEIPEMDLQNETQIESKGDLIENRNKEIEEPANITTEENLSQDETIVSDKCIDELNNDEENIPANIEETLEKIDTPLNSLENMGSQLTIKSLSETNNKVTNEQQIQNELENSEINKKSIQESNTDDDEAPEKIDESTIKSNALKSLNLNKGITVNSVVKNSHPSPLISGEKPMQPKQNVNVCTNKSLQTLKSLSKFITVKQTNSSPPLNQNLGSDDDNDEKDFMSADENENADNDPLQQPPVCVKQQRNNTKVIPTKTPSNEYTTETKNNSISMASQRNVDILKRLTNVTAKSIPITKNIPLSQKPVKEKIPINVSVKKETVNPKKDNIIEILNIDDSDSDADSEHIVKTHQNNASKPVKIPNKNIVKPTSTHDLRGLNKNITIKSMSQQSSNYTAYKSNSGEECKKTVINRSYETKNVNIIRGNNKLLEEQKNLQNTIKNLRRHITIKSKKSPQFNSDFQPEEMNDADSIGHSMNPDEDHDSDCSEGRIKITELNEEDFSDNKQNVEEESQARVESPHSYNSDEEIPNEDDIDENFPDIESQIKINPIVKTNQHLKPPTKPQKSNISHLSELTIKPVRQGNTISDDEIKTNDKVSDTARNVTNASKPSTSKTVNQEKQISKNVQSSQKASSSSNQISTVKTVKTYQSQTVIEEITTTVTKTIRTVNTQEVQNTSQNISRPTIRPQKIINKPSNIMRASPIRQPSPAIGTKVRNSVPPQLVSSNTNAIRPSNMLVSARPRQSAPRVQNPTNIRKIAPQAQNQPRPYTQNRPLKISPQLTNNTKRQSEEASGHFSCFKKPKESLIPVQDIPDMSEDGTMQYSCSQSKSSITNVTKVLNSTGSTSQTRSESSSSSQQHIAKLSGVSGLKIVKTSSQQSKQVEEKCENVNTPKNDTIAALEKLQRQGLLIKKPRLDTTDYEHNSCSGSDGEAYEE